MEFCFTCKIALEESPHKLIRRLPYTATEANGGDSYFLFHALPVFFIKYCHKLCIYKDKWWFDESTSVTFCMENT